MCEITREDFERFLDRCPTIGIRILKTVGGRLRQVESKFSELVFQSAPARLATLLLQLGESMGERDQDTIRLNVCLTHQNLANGNVENKWATFQDGAGDAFSPFCRSHVQGVRSARQTQMSHPSG